MALPHYGGSACCNICWKNNIYTHGTKYQDGYYCKKHLKKIQRLDKINKINKNNENSYN